MVDNNVLELQDGCSYVRQLSFDEIVRKTKKDEEEFINKMNRFKIAQLIQIMTSRISMEQVDRMIMEEMQLSYVFDSCAVLLFSGMISGILIGFAASLIDNKIPHLKV